jgi:hypothetical protein
MDAGGMPPRERAGLRSLPVVRRRGRRRDHRGSQSTDVVDSGADVRFAFDRMKASAKGTLRLWEAVERSIARDLDAEAGLSATAEPDGGTEPADAHRTADRRVDGDGRPERRTAAEETVSGLAETVASVLHTRAFRAFSEGLRQYLTIRTASVDDADALLRRLRLDVREWPVHVLLAPPGARARMYAHARGLCAAHLAKHGDPLPRDRAALPWRAASRTARPEYRRALDKLRTEFDPSDAELVELAYARELSPDEIAYVVGLSPDAAAAALARATAAAKAVLGPSPTPAVPGPHGALIEAYSLDARPTRASTLDSDGETGALPAGTVVGDRYEVEKRVGAGAFGEVYRARDREVDGHVVALKILHQPALSENARANALRELRLIASVFHPSIVQFKDHGWFGGRLWFVMPWYEGETLEERIRREPLDRAEARRLFEPIAKALATMHASGLRHQDIKPDNVFLARLKSAPGAEHDVLPVLLDLGVAAKDTERILAGTPAYFAPEVAAQFAQVETNHPVGLAADVFALALTLRNSLEPETQEEVAGSAVEAFIQHRARNVPRLPRGADLRYLEPHFRRWLALDPSERPTAAEFVRELAVLTQPEETRERRNATLRWLLPLVLAATAVFGSAVFALKREAQRNEARARLAEREAADVRGHLWVARAREQALSDDLSEARRRIQAENLNREQMETALARERATSTRLAEALEGTEARAREVRARLESETSRATRLEADLLASRSEREQLLARATTLEQDLGRTRRELGARETELQSARAEVDRLTREVAEVRARAESMAAQVEEMRRQLDQARATAAQAEARASEAAAERGRLEGEVAELRREAAQLRARLAQAQAPAAAGGSTTGPGDPGASGGPGAAQPDGTGVTPAPGATPGSPMAVPPASMPTFPSTQRRLLPQRIRVQPQPRSP